MTNKPKTVTSDRKRGSGVKFAYDILREEILDLALPPGSSIDEVQLAERLKMSRTPIREALVRLAGEGLVTTLPNRSTIVTPIDFLNLYTFFDAITLMYRVTTRLAAEYRSAEDIALIRARAADYTAAAAAGDALAMIATNREFHVTIAEAGRNPYYTMLFTRLMDEGRRIMPLYYSSYDSQPADLGVVEHAGMIAAIEARDIAAADRLATAHADGIVSQIRNFVSRDGRQKLAL